MDQQSNSPQQSPTALKTLFAGFNCDAYFTDAPANKELPWGPPQGKEIW